ncbi:hypothetical protein BABINDRAFT_5868 [Babjeviella inositovora NRRL Y-12698]|uniref:PCI domain-containing protein n=1 Tax=Babjeviella inositovora NRRL Y-12698 TaxID=984486 RepID=A0A1E3QZ94_9ASCO|nr:uncharacterized protein BABINDRAFT_5868 [Babjeviella inositovora NRRL Y-12698]ODQ82990.1 hypothetical protein BABINDRAFT_5868 [Babjeviella inositovora NRRL Y-12698]
MDQKLLFIEGAITQEFSLALQKSLLESFNSISASLQTQDFTNAELHLSRLTTLANSQGDTEGTRDVRFKIGELSSAVLARNGKFLDAGTKLYHQLKQFTSSISDNSYLVPVYESLIEYLILAPSTIQKHKVIHALVTATPEVSHVSPALQALLHKEYLFQFVEAEDLQIKLPEYFTTPLRAAIMEHNILSMSLLYSNVTFVRLEERFGGLLILFDTALDENSFIDVVSRMVLEKRLKARIDQQKGVVHFDKAASGGVSRWNLDMRDWLLKLDRVCNLVGESTEEV